MASELRAQVLYGSLTGNVTDSTTAPIPSALVKVVNNDTGFTRETQTNNDGIYTFSELTSGTYSVTIQAQGFGAFEQKNLAIFVNSIQRVNASLNPGQVVVSVNVDTSAPLLQTDKADTNYNIEQEQIANLPTTSTTGRNFESLFKLVPGSTPPAESNSQAGNPQRAQVYNVNGVTNTTNSTRIDGAIDAYPSLPSLAAYLPPPDAIENINLVTGSFNAEQGSAGGAAVNVTIKSGTNQFHGSLWEYNSIANFNAQSWQTRTGIRAKNIYNEYGLAFGGPILHDKLFFFGDWNRVSTKKASSGVASVPTPVIRTGDFSAYSTIIYDPATGNPSTGAGKTPFPGNKIPSNRISAAATTLLSLLPGPTTTGELNNFLMPTTVVYLRDNIDTKLTYNPNQSTSIFGHYSLSPDTVTDPQIFGAAGGAPWDAGQPGSSTGRIQNVGLGATRIISQHFLLDANAGYTRQFVQGRAPDASLGDYGTSTLKIPGTNQSGNIDYAGIPGFFFGTGYNPLGNSTSSNPFVFRDNQYTGNINATWGRGAHSYRFGGEYLHGAINHFQPGSLANITPRGGFTFSGGVTALSGGPAPNNFNALADFLLGTPSALGRVQEAYDPVTNRYSTFSFYAQDTWQVSHNLTLNYGARYEYYPIATADHYGIIRYDPTVQTTVTDATGTHSVGTTIIGGQGGIPNDTGINNHHGNLVPRFGVSYRINDATVIRAGFGITIDPDNFRSILNSYPSTIGLAVNASNAYVQAGTLTTGVPSITVPNIASGRIPLPYNIGTVTLPKDYRRGYIESYNLSLQRQLPAKLVASAAYVGTHAIRQQTLVNINAAPPGGGTAGRILNATYGTSVNTHFNDTDITSVLPFRGSIYNGLQLQLTHASGKYARFGTVFTYSRSMDISDNGVLNGLAYSYPTYWDKNWAASGYDRKHNFQFWSVLDSPVGSGKKFNSSKLLSLLAGGWQLGNTLSRVSGTPFTVSSATTSLNAPGNSQFADVMPGVSSVIRQNTNGFRQYLNPAAFTAVTAVRFGTAGRNSVRGPGIFDLDTSLKRSFPIWRESSITFQAEAFNITNTPAFANPAATISTASTFGIITTSNSNRSIRLSGHINF